MKTYDKCITCGIEIKQMPFAKYLRRWGYCVECCPKDIWQKVSKCKSPSKRKKRKEKIQCNGVTAKGKRCKHKGRWTGDDIYYCPAHVHQNNDPVTRKKTPKEVYAEDYLTSQHWKTLSSFIRKLYKNKCQMCGNKGWVVHHKTYRNRGNEYPEDLTLLCDKCHKAFHDSHKYNKKDHCFEIT